MAQSIDRAAMSEHDEFTWPGPDRYAAACILLVLSIVAYAVAPANPWGRLVALLVEGLTLLFILRTSAATRRALRLATATVLLAVLSTGILALTNRTTTWATGLIGAMLVLQAPVAIVRRLLGQERVTGATIAGAVCLYLMAGLFYALVYSAVDGLGGGFFAQPHVSSPLNYVYFSFTTISTVGYGDLTPTQTIGKLLANSEAVGGQLYLVTVIAVLVSNIGRTRAVRPPR